MEDKFGLPPCWKTVSSGSRPKWKNSNLSNKSCGRGRENFAAWKHKNGRKARENAERGERVSELVQQRARLSEVNLVWLKPAQDYWNFCLMGPRRSDQLLSSGIFFQTAEISCWTCDRYSAFLACYGNFRSSSRCLRARWGDSQMESTKYTAGIARAVPPGQQIFREVYKKMIEKSAYSCRMTGAFLSCYH